MSKYLCTNRETAARALQKLFRATDRKLVNHAYDAEITVMDRRLDVNPAGIQAVLEDISKTDPRAKKVVPQDLIDRRYLDDVEKSGFFWPVVVGKIAISESCSPSRRVELRLHVGFSSLRNRK